MKDTPITLTLNKTEQQAVRCALWQMNHDLRSRAEYAAQIGSDCPLGEVAGCLDEARKVEALMTRLHELNP